MNYIDSRDFDLSGDDKQGVDIVTYEDHSVAIVVHDSTVYGEERSCENKITNLEELDALITELQTQRNILRKGEPRK